MEQYRHSGKVWLIGAGTGDAGLMTVKGMEILKQAEVVVFDALASLEILSLMPRCAELIDAGKVSGRHTLTQDEINKLLISKAKEGKRVIRLKGGDPFVFGRGGEELEALANQNIAFEVVPGITSSVAVAAYGGIPVTHRDCASSFHVITGHRKKNGNLNIDFKSLVALDATLVFLMGAASLKDICQGLLDAGIDQNMPAVVLEKGTTSRQRKVEATVSTLKEAAYKALIKSPAVIIVGKVCSLGSTLSWYEKLPLSNKQILVTRPESQAQELASKLKLLGAHIVQMPAIETIKIYKPVELENFYKAVEEIYNSKCKKCIVFTSPQGVFYFFELLRDRKIDIRKLFICGNVKFAVIGAGTENALKKYGIFADYMPLKYSSEDLGKLLVSKADHISHMYIFRAKKGSIGLTDKLDNAGICYSDIPIYNTVYTKPYQVTEKIAAAFSNKEFDFVTFTSTSTVEGFVSLFKDIDYKNIKAVCIGDKTAARALLYGMDVIVSKEATTDSMVAAVLEEAAKERK